MTNDPPSTATHRLRLFVAEAAVLARFRDAVPSAHVYALTAAARCLVIPFDEDLQDALHRCIGTGDWPPTVTHALSTTDMAFAAQASGTGPLAYIETDYTGAVGTQTAALWRAGRLAIPPLTIDTATALARPPAVWPINAVLRALAIEASPPDDEFTAFGLRNWTSNAEIHAGARRIA